MFINKYICKYIFSCFALNNTSLSVTEVISKRDKIVMKMDRVFTTRKVYRQGAVYDVHIPDIEYACFAQ